MAAPSFSGEMSLRELMHAGLHAYGLKPTLGARHEAMHGLLHYLERTGRLPFPANGNWTAEVIVDAIERFFPAYDWKIPEFSYPDFCASAQKTAAENRDEENLRRMLEFSIAKVRAGMAKKTSVKALGRLLGHNMERHINYAKSLGIDVSFPKGAEVSLAAWSITLPHGEVYSYSNSRLKPSPKGFALFSLPPDPVLQPIFEMLRPGLMLMRDKFFHAFLGFGEVRGQDQLNERARIAQDAMLDLRLAEIFSNDFPQRKARPAFAGSAPPAQPV